MVFRNCIIAFIFAATGFVTFGSELSYAQIYEPQGVSLSPGARHLKRNFTTIIFSSLAGGILGLSTLSFYGQPQEHTVNITTGILLGLAGGLTYVIYDHGPPANNNRPMPTADEALQMPKAPLRTPTYLALSWDFE